MSRLSIIAAIALLVPAAAHAREHGVPRSGAHHQRPARAPARPPIGHRPGGVLPLAGSFRPPRYRPPRGYWHGDIWARPPLAAPAFRYPPGYRYHRYRPGLFLPGVFFAPPFFRDWHRAGLFAPPPGHHWVRVGPDLLLVENGSRRIAEARYGVFRG